MNLRRTSRLFISHSLLPLSYLPRKRGEKTGEEAIFSQGVDTSAETGNRDYAFLNARLVAAADGISLHPLAPRCPRPKIKLLPGGKYGVSELNSSGVAFQSIDLLPSKVSRVQK